MSLGTVCGDGTVGGDRASWRELPGGVSKDSDALAGVWGEDGKFGITSLFAKPFCKSASGFVMNRKTSCRCRAANLARRK